MTDLPPQNPPAAKGEDPKFPPPNDSKVLSYVLPLLFLLGLCLTIWAHGVVKASYTPKSIPSHPQRIVTLAPSVTETVFAVGLGPQVKGVTSFCHYPPEVMDIPKVAGFSDVNVEAILRLRPDLVILPVDKTYTQAELTRLGLTVLPMDTRTLSGLLKALEDLGRATSHEAQAQEVIDRINSAIAFAKENALGKPKPRVLFSVMHSYVGLDYITEITIAGQDGFFNNLLEICGGENVYKGALPFPSLSREAIFTLNPDVIIDLLRSELEGELALKAWLNLTNINAVKNNRLYMFTDEADSVPGPRIYNTIRKISLAVHPAE